MNLKSIRWRLPLSYAAIALLAALALGSVMLLVLDRYYTRQERDYLRSNALSLETTVEQALRSQASPDSLANLVEGLSFLSQTRIRILDAQGRPLADSGVPASNQLVSITSTAADGTVLSVPPDAVTVVTGSAQSQGELNVQLDQPGVLAGASTTFTNGNTILTINASPYGYGFASLPVESGSAYTTHRSAQVVSLELADSLGTLEISKGPAYGRDILRSVSLAWAGAGLVATLLAALVGWFASRMVTHPLLALQSATRRMEAGDLSARVDLLEKRPAAEFQALAHSFNLMAGRVEGTVSTLLAFVADAAHELHTPLTALRTNLELAADEADAARRSLFLQHAQEQGQRLEGLAGGLLDLSRIEASPTVSDLEPFVLNPLLQELGEHFAARAEQAGLAFALNLPADPVTAWADEARLRRALTNLLENALKFTPAGGKIVLRLAVEAQAVVLRVEDSGIGIPAEDLPRLFERFHRGRNASAYPGSGLGLAIVKALVEAQGGEVAAESGPEGGTCLTVRLPPQV